MTSNGAPLSAHELFGALPESLATELTDVYEEIARNFREGRWEPSELNGGKLCEVVYSILRGYADGKYPAKAKKPKNMVSSCQALESAGSGVPRSARIQMPRVLIALYEIRNNRGVGHVGGDVDPNHMDAVFVLAAAKWIMGELVRIFHDVDTQTATAAVEALASRTIPIIWQSGRTRRVLRTDLSQTDKVLLLTFGNIGVVDEADLRRWVEAPNASSFRRDVLKKAHAKKHIEYRQSDGTIEITPLGARYVEENLPLTL